MVSQEVTYEIVVYLKVMFYSNCYSGSHLYILYSSPLYTKIHRVFS